MIKLPEPANYSLGMLAERWAASEEIVEQHLKENTLAATIRLLSVCALYEANDHFETPVWLGGTFEIADYKNILWDANGNCDFAGRQVGLRKLAGDPLQYKAAWEESGKRRSLRYYWRMNTSGHKVFLPMASLVINRQEVYVETPEVLAFEADFPKELRVGQEEKLRGTMKERSKQKDINRARNLAKAYVAECVKKKITPSIDVITNQIATVEFSSKYTVKGQIRRWITNPDKTGKRIFPGKSSKQGRREGT